LGEVFVFFVRVVREKNRNGVRPRGGGTDLGLPRGEDLVGKPGGVETEGAVRGLDKKLFRLVLRGVGRQGLVCGCGVERMSNCAGTEEPSEDCMSGVEWREGLFDVHEASISFGVIFIDWAAEREFSWGR